MKITGDRPSLVLVRIHGISSVIALAALMSLATRASGVLPLHEQWREANRALQGNQAVRAHALFEELDHWYGKEQAIREPLFREKLLRLWGLAALQAGATARGIEILERWLGENPDQLRFRAFIRFQVANAHRLAGNNRAAEGHWAKFVTEHPELPECSLVRWLWAELLLAKNNPGAARPQLECVADDPGLPPAGRELAQAALAMIELSAGQKEVAHRILSQPDRRSAAFILWRAVMAPWLARQFLEVEAFAEAVEACQWFDHPDNLQRTYAGLQVAGKTSPSVIRNRIWLSHWRNQLNRLGSALVPSETEGTGVAELYRLKVLILLKADRALEAGILATALLEPGSQLTGLRSFAFASAIEANHLLERWSIAQELTDQFLEAHPDDPQLPDILFLQARTAAGLKNHALALERIRALLQSQPDHRSAKSWKVAEAGWMLESGDYGPALERFRQLETDCPPAWKSFLQFQQARCLDQADQTGKAVATYHSLAGSADPHLSEQAYLALLKIHLRELEDTEFKKVLSHYRKDHPSGQGLPMAGLLEGSLHELHERIPEALLAYEGVPENRVACKDQARERISMLHRRYSDFTALRNNALQWIADPERETPFPEQPLLDFLHYQRELNKPALSPERYASLFESFASGSHLYPGAPLLAILSSQWPRLQSGLQSPVAGFRQWLRQQMGEFHAAGKWAPYASSSLFLADELESEGRSDSSDTLRISVLRDVPPETLSGNNLYAVARTSARYDFPDAGNLLQGFIVKHPDAPKVPGAMLLLAGIHRSAGRDRIARDLLGEIHSVWPDATVHAEALLLLAEWQLEDECSETPQTLSTLLDRNDLSPAMAAKALLLRARYDLREGNHSRCESSCRRILALYPAFHDIFAESEKILQSIPHA